MQAPDITNPVEIQRLRDQMVNPPLCSQVSGL